MSIISQYIYTWYLKNAIHITRIQVGRTARPFRYDLNQITYDYIVEVTNRFKGLDLMERVPDELWMEVCDIV